MAFLLIDYLFNILVVLLLFLCNQPNVLSQAVPLYSQQEPLVLDESESLSTGITTLVLVPAPELRQGLGPNLFIKKDSIKINVMDFTLLGVVGKLNET